MPEVWELQEEGSAVQRDYQNILLLFAASYVLIFQIYSPWLLCLGFSLRVNICSIPAFHSSSGFVPPRSRVSSSPGLRQFAGLIQRTVTREIGLISGIQRDLQMDSNLKKPGRFRDKCGVRARLGQAGGV